MFRFIRSSQAIGAVASFACAVLVLATVFTFFAPLAHATGYGTGDITVMHPVATPSRPGVKSGGVFFNAIENRGDQADRLVGASSPVAGRVEVHEMSTVDNVMRMREIGSIEIPAGSKVPMARGTPPGYHLMLMEMTRPVSVGDRFPLTVEFERAGKLDVEVVVEEIKVDAGMQHHGGHGMSHGSHDAMKK